jgi:hypothetical protein
MAPYGDAGRGKAHRRHHPRVASVEQLWTRMTGDFGFMELCEFSFSDEVMS